MRFNSMIQIFLVGMVPTLLLNCGGGSEDNSNASSLISPASTSTTTGTTPSIIETAPQNYLGVALMLDSAGENDNGFNQLALTGARQATAETENVVFDYVVAQPTDNYSDILEKIINSGYDLIITLGLPMAEATAQVAKTHPQIYFVIIDVMYDSYQTLPNVASVMFAEDQMGYLAGILAACMTTSQIIGSVAGGENIANTRLLQGFQNGARSVKQFITILHQTINEAEDFVKGRQYAEAFILQGADVIFGAGGQAGNGALEAAAAAGTTGLKAIGVNVDQYFTVPEKVGRYLMTSAIKRVEVATAQMVQEFAKNKQVKSGVYYFSVADHGVGLAPYHDWETQVFPQCKQRVEQAQQNLVEGKINTGVILQ